MQEKKKRISSLILTGTALSGMASTAATTASANFNDFLKNFKDGTSRGIDILRSGTYKELDMLKNGVSQGFDIARTGVSKLKTLAVEHPVAMSIAVLEVTGICLARYVYEKIYLLNKNSVKKISKKFQIQKLETFTIRSAKELKDKIKKTKNKDSYEIIDFLFEKLSQTGIKNLETLFNEIGTYPESFVLKDRRTFGSFSANLAKFLNKLDSTSTKGLALLLKNNYNEAIVNLIYINSADFQKGFKQLLKNIEGKETAIALSSLINNFNDKVVDGFAVLLIFIYDDMGAMEGFLHLLKNIKDNIKAAKGLASMCERLSNHPDRVGKYVNFFKFCSNKDVAKKVVWLLKNTETKSISSELDELIKNENSMILKVGC